MVQEYLRQVMTEREIDLAVNRMAAEIIQRHADLSNAVLIGIRRRGVPLGERLQRQIKKQSGRELPLGILDITFYRDDLSLVASQPVVEGSRLSFDVEGKVIILVDDVIFTGRTTRAALESVLDYGRPSRVELAVLIDRGHRELPIQADYVGKYVETSVEELVEVRIPPYDDSEGVYVGDRDTLRQAADR